MKEQLLNKIVEKEEIDQQKSSAAEASESVYKGKGYFFSWNHILD